MSQFVYFLPGETKGQVSPAELEAVGLGHVHDGLHLQCVQDAVLDGVGRGMLLSVADAAVPPGAAADLRIVPAEQAWRPGPKTADGKPAYHVGMWKDALPTAASLVRRKPMGSIELALQNGGPWLIPVALATAGRLDVPTVLRLGDDGNWSGRASPQYRTLCDRAADAYRMLLAPFVGETTTINFTRAMAVVVAVLAASYRIGPVEIDMLELVGSDDAVAVLEAVTDWQLFKDACEKKAAARRASGSSDTGSGGKTA